MKKIISYFIVLIICFILIGGNIKVYAWSSIPDLSTSLITPLADIIEWRYKIEDEKIYKRLYNYTKDVWIGDWILVS